MYALYGMPIAGTFVSSEMLLGGAMASGYMVTASNMAVKVNDYASGVAGNNAIERVLGQDGSTVIGPNPFSNTGSWEQFIPGKY